MTKSIAFTLLGLMALLLVGCGDKAEDFGTTPEEDHGSHGAKNGGQYVEIGDHAAFVEFKLDHSNALLKVWIESGGHEALAIDDAPTLTFKVGEETKELTAKSSTGETPSAEWGFVDDAFEGDPESMRFSFKLDGEIHTCDVPGHHD